ncbi:hypothetical protein GCM10027273_17270 [Nocardioides pakistanensis]
MENVEPLSPVDETWLGRPSEVSDKAGPPGPTRPRLRRPSGPVAAKAQLPTGGPARVAGRRIERI